MSAGYWTLNIKTMPERNKHTQKKNAQKHNCLKNVSLPVVDSLKPIQFSMFSFFYVTEMQWALWFPILYINTCILFEWNPYYFDNCIEGNVRLK